MYINTFNLLKENHTSTILKASMERYVSQELCLQIFLNLPVKSLLRFKCVCKVWNTIISSKTFSYSYLAHKKSSSNTKKYLLFEHDEFYSAHCINCTKSCYVIDTTTNHMGVTNQNYQRHVLNNMKVVF